MQPAKRVARVVGSTGSNGFTRTTWAETSESGASIGIAADGFMVSPVSQDGDNEGLAARTDGNARARCGVEYSIPWSIGN